MNDALAPPSQGPVAGKYQLVRLIGRGGMGSVWEARHLTLGTSSAIKFIEAEYANSQEARSRFDKEARAAATIQSKHAIQVFDHGVTEDGKPYIVMELLQGEPLDKCIERERLTLQTTARIVQQVCRGLARAHEKGIVHRDLKPENIFLVKTPDDDEPIAKVLDFGIAKMNEVGGGLTSSTKTGAVLGTPFYMSPEQARGLRTVDHRADVWSLGVIAFKCLTGKLPFDGESVGDLLVKICTAPVPIPSRVYPWVPPNFDAWFLRALERDPEHRFSNVTELADALCFAAGIAVRSNYGGVQSGRVPSGPMGSSGYPIETPSYGSAPAVVHGVTPPPQAARVDHPGAMTNAPFTSESIPGVTSSRSKLIAGSAVGLLAIAGLVFGLYVSRAPGRPAGVVIATSGPTPATSDPGPPVTKSVDRAEPRVEPGPTLAAETAMPPPARTATAKATPPQVGKTTATAKPSPAPPLPPTTATAPGPPPTPAPAASVKKPNRNDPGY